MFSLRRLLAALILIVVLALGVAIWRHLQQQSPLELLEALPEQVDLSLETLHYTQNEDGARSWTLDADKAEYRRDAGQALLENVRLTLYNAGRAGTVDLTAEQGVLWQEKQQVEVWGNVVVATAKDEHLYAERLRYDGHTRQLLSDDPVRVVSPRMELRGGGLQADVAQGHLLLKDNVWMLLLPAERNTENDE